MTKAEQRAVLSATTDLRVMREAIANAIQRGDKQTALADTNLLAQIVHELRKAVGAEPLFHAGYHYPAARPGWLAAGHLTLDSVPRGCYFAEPARYPQHQRMEMLPMARRPPDLKLDFDGSGLTPAQADQYGRQNPATWALFTNHPTLGVIPHSNIYMRRDELLREYESFGSYPLIARPR